MMARIAMMQARERRKPKAAPALRRNSDAADAWFKENDPEGVSL
jgi:hypothetical protein